MPEALPRDLRIDALRGLSLLMISTNHAAYLSGNHLLRDYSLQTLTLTDCANVFIFISGYVAGLVYGRVLDDGGFRDVFRKAARRARQLYVWHVLALAVTVAIVGAFRLGGVGALAQARLSPLFVRPLEAVPAALGLIYTPYAFDVLRLYILLLLALPFWLWLLRRRPVVALLVSAGLYAVPLLFPGAAIVDWPDGLQWYFNPLSWQLLFFLGTALARCGLPGPQRLWRSRGLLAACGCVVVVGVLVRTAAPAVMAAWDPRVPFIHDDLVWGKLPWTGKPNLEFTRLVYFGALSLVVLRVLPRALGLWRSRLAAPVVACGRKALQTYCLGLCLVYLIAALTRIWGDGNVMIAGLTAAGWGIQMLAAVAMTRRGSRAAPG
ncbi:OpgC domain-containing protein [bacterium]|nr:OpgC domain-containing protein [bacterium]MBU1073412.1 OpgC domain-containing protein [bacterium]MBU1676359.1 OpgC domain-containing protein [bacterium]